MKHSWMIYGATGYSGRLVVEEAVKRGHRPFIAGRSAEKVEALAKEFGLQGSAFPLTDTESVKKHVGSVELVFNAAGPFNATAQPLMRACVSAGVHYVDITGEIPVFERAHLFDRQAKQKGIAIIPGVGFDVIPTDCMAAYVASKVPEAVELHIGFRGLGGLSPGTLKTMVNNLPHGIYARRDGKLSKIRAGSGARKIRFPDGFSTMIPISWGDLSTAFHSTHVPNITTYTALPWYYPYVLPVLFSVGGPLIKRPEIHAIVERYIERHVKGPDERTRTTGKAYVWAMAVDRNGKKHQSWLQTMEGYHFTGVAGVRSVEKVFSIKPVGALTPAQAFGTDYVLTIPQTSRADSPDQLGKMNSPTQEIIKMTRVHRVQSPSVPASR